MYKNIFGTFMFRLLAAVITFGVVFISSRALGPERYGTIGLVMVAIGIVLLFSALIGGTSLVYFTARVSPASLFTISSLWGLIISFVITMILYLLQLFPEDYFYYIFLISFVATISQNLMFIILGKERIQQQNIINTIQVFSHCAIIAFLFHGIKNPSIQNYLNSVLISHCIAALIGIICCRKEILPLKFSGLTPYMIEIAKYGFWVQLSSIIHLFNFRLSYYFVDWFLGRELLGIYTLAVQLAESFWILPKSAGLVQFAHISNMKVQQDGIKLSYKLMQLMILIVAILSVPVFFIPEEWITYVFGYGYAGIKNVLILLLPAIIIYSGAIIIIHHFSGIGKVWVNAFTGLIGLVMTIGFGLILIPQSGVYGAAYTAGICYTSIFILSLFFFVRISKTSLYNLWKDGISFRILWNQLKSLDKRKEK